MKFILFNASKPFWWGWFNYRIPGKVTCKHLVWCSLWVTKAVDLLSGPALLWSLETYSPVPVGFLGWFLMVVLFTLVLHKYLFSITTCWQWKGIQHSMYRTNVTYNRCPGNERRGSIIYLISCLHIYQGHQLKETVLPSLTLLTESSRIHRETRKFLRSKVCYAVRGFKYFWVSIDNDTFMLLVFLWHTASVL